jgi:hypothetical protein
MDGNMMDKKEFEKLMIESTKVASETARVLIAGADGQGHIITAAMAIVMGGLEKQHPGVIKDIMTGALLIKAMDGIETKTEEMPDLSGETIN